MKFILLLVFLSNYSYADSPISAGILDYKEHSHVVSSQYTYFKNGQKDIFGDYRYGMGSGQLEIGSKNVAIHAKAHNGISALGWEGDRTGVFWHFGIEMYQGEIRVNTTSSFNNFYLYQPAFAPGVQGSFGKFKYTLNYRKGYTISNYYKVSGWGPKLDSMDGVGMYLEYKEINFIYERANFAHLNRETIDVAYGRLHILTERDQQSKSFLLGYRFPL